MTLEQYSSIKISDALLKYLSLSMYLFNTALIPSFQEEVRQRQAAAGESYEGSEPEARCVT